MDYEIGMSRSLFVAQCNSTQDAGGSLGQAARDKRAPASAPIFASVGVLTARHGAGGQKIDPSTGQWANTDDVIVNNQDHLSETRDGFTRKENGGEI